MPYELCMRRIMSPANGVIVIGAMRIISPLFSVGIIRLPRIIWWAVWCSVS